MIEQHLNNTRPHQACLCYAGSSLTFLEYERSLQSWYQSALANRLHVLAGEYDPAHSKLHAVCWFRADFWHLLRVKAFCCVWCSGSLCAGGIYRIYTIRKARRHRTFPCAFCSYHTRLCHSLSVKWINSLTRYWTSGVIENIQFVEKETE